MERIDKQIVASGLGLLSVAGLGTGLAHADTVQRAVSQAVVSLSGQGQTTQTNVTTPAPLKIATGKIVAPTPATPQAVVTTTPEIYRVQYGDSLWDIAKAHHVSVAELVANNQGSDLISVGQELVLPTTQATTSPSIVDTQPVAPTINADQTTASTNVAVTTTTPSDGVVQPAPEQSATQPLVQLNHPTVIDAVTHSVTSTNGNVTSETTNEVASASDQLRQPTAATIIPPTENNHDADVNVNHTPGTAVADAKPAQPVTLPTTMATVSDTAPGTTSSVVALAQALTQQNIPYTWGGDNLAGLDCSGLVRYVFQEAIGKTLPHSSVAQEGVVQKKAVADAKPGDLLFWGTSGASYHVAIYIGNQAYVTAPGPGETVRVETISSAFMPSFAGQF